MRFQQSRYLFVLALTFLSALLLVSSSRAHGEDEVSPSWDVFADTVIRDGDLRGHSAKPLYGPNGRVSGLSLVNEDGKVYFTGRKITEQLDGNGRAERVTFSNAKNSRAIFVPESSQGDWMICIPLSWKGVGYCLLAYACEYACEH